jgi:hypothetical protein
LRRKPLLGEDELVLFCEIEVSYAFGIATQRHIGLISGKALEGDQGEGDVVAAPMRYEMANEVAATRSYDGEPLAWNSNILGEAALPSWPTR